jgi:hypothetical protein
MSFRLSALLLNDIKLRVILLITVINAFLLSVILLNAIMLRLVINATQPNVTNQHEVAIFCVLAQQSMQFCKVHVAKHCDQWHSGECH